MLRFYLQKQNHFTTTISFCQENNCFIVQEKTAEMPAEFSFWLPLTLPGKADRLENYLLMATGIRRPFRRPMVQARQVFPGVTLFRRPSCPHAGSDNLSATNLKKKT